MLKLPFEERAKQKGISYYSIIEKPHALKLVHEVETLIQAEQARSWVNGKL